jgi:hypothetical protein
MCWGDLDYLTHTAVIWHGFRFLMIMNIVKMKNAYSVKEKLTMIILGTSVCCFGLILPDSLSTHVKMVHFAAHFGMSFLLALSFYLVCTVKMQASKTFSYTVLIVSTLFIGVVYKYWEIATQGMIGKYSFSAVLESTGAMTSMSQNLSGLMAAMFLIESLVEKNLVMSVVRSGGLRVGPADLHVVSMHGIKTGNSLPKLTVANKVSSIPANN